MKTKKQNMLKVFLFIILTSLTILVRTVNIGKIPGNLSPDEIDTLRTFIEFIHRQNPKITGYNWNGAPFLNAYLIGWFWLASGKTYAGIKIASIIFSTLAVLAFYIYSKKITKNNGLRLLGSLLLATDPWFLNFSRSGWENIFNAFTLMLVLIGLEKLKKNKLNLTPLLLLIIGSTLGFYFYHPGKLFIPVTFIFITFNFFKKTTRINLFYFLAFIISTGALILPQLISMASPSNQLRSLGRIKNVSVLHYSDTKKEVIKNVKKNVSGFLFFRKKDFNIGLNSRYVPLDDNIIYYLLVPFYLLGLIISLKKHKKLLALYFLTLLPIQIFSRGTPNAARAVHVVPVIYAFILIGINWITNKINQFSNKIFILKPLLPVLIFIFLVSTCFINVKRYFLWIQNEKTLKGREPAIWREEYYEWLSATRKAVKEKGTSFSVYDWKNMKE